MTERRRASTKAYQNTGFLNSKDARALRILSEYLEPKSRFDHHKVDDTIVFMGSARVKSREAAEEMLRRANSGEDRQRAQMALKMSAYYEAARELASRLTQWSKELDREERRFVVCTGGGPGIMEAANRGAAEAKGLNVGLTISLPSEEFDNPYVTRELAFHFHYFFMRKFWFTYLAKAVIVFPGGYGTLDELFELLTLVQTRKMRKPMPMVLFGTEYWRQIVDFDALARHGVINPEDIELVHRTDSVEDAYDWIVGDVVAKREGGAPSGHRIRGGRRIAGQRNELVVIAIGQLDAPGAPIGLRLLDPLPRGRDEIPLDEALAHGRSAQKHDDGRGRRAKEHRPARLEHQHLAAVEGLSPHFDLAFDDIRRALGILGRKLRSCARIERPMDVEHGRMGLHLGLGSERLAREEPRAQAAA